MLVTTKNSILKHLSTGVSQRIFLFRKFSIKSFETCFVIATPQTVKIHPKPAKSSQERQNFDQNKTSADENITQCTRNQIEHVEDYEMNFKREN